MAESLHTVLSSAYAPKLALAERENLSVREEQTIYRLCFGKRRLCVAYQVDGHIIKAGNKCDYLILAREDDPDKWKSIFVELKGTDVVHALQQLDATIGNRIFHHDSVGELHARIVAKSFPANNANVEFERAKRKFKQKHKSCSLKQISSQRPDLIP